MNIQQQAVSTFVQHVTVLTVVEKSKYTINIPVVTFSVYRIKLVF